MTIFTTIMSNEMRCTQGIYYLLKSLKFLSKKRRHILNARYPLHKIFFQSFMIHCFFMAEETDACYTS